MKKNNYKVSSDYIVEESSLLLDYLFLMITNKSKNNIKSLLARGNVLVDGKATTKYNYVLHPKQKVTVKWTQIHDKEHEEVLDVVYEDNDMIVINKPAGLLSVATDNEKENTAYRMVTEYVRMHNPGSRAFVVHRIDRDTSGLLLIAKNESIKHLLQDNWDKIVSIRGYIAVVEGVVENAEGTIKSWLKETPTQMIYSSQKIGDGKEAITRYTKIKDNGIYSLLSINIDTGRKNQIRVHMNDIGHSIVGDKKYYAKTNPLKRLGLHAHVLEFKHPIMDKVMHFEAPIPAEFIKIVR